MRKKTLKTSKKKKTKALACVSQGAGWVVPNLFTEHGSFSIPKWDGKQIVQEKTYQF